MTTAKKIAKKLGIIAVILIAGFGFFLLFSHGFDKQEVVECMTLEGYSKEFDSFFITKWQDEMCRRQGIIIDTEVR